MKDLYAPVKEFIREEIDSGRMKINPLDSMIGTIGRFHTEFTQRGWKRVPVESKVNHWKVFDPEGQEALYQVAGEAFRHPQVTIDACENKPLAKKLLNFNGIRVPEGAEFGRDEKEVELVFFNAAPKPLVFKPTNAGGSQGVTVGVVEARDFDAAWHKAANSGGPRSRVQIEEFVPGVEVRVFVVGNQVKAVLARLQPFVEGNGVSTISELIESAEEARKINVRLNKARVTPDPAFLKAQGIALDSVPEDRDIVLLSSSTIFRSGGMMGDITDLVPDALNELAVRAVRSIPHLEIAGIDFLVRNIHDVETAIALEINTLAAVEPHIYPAWGKSRPLVEDIITYFHDDYLRSHNKA